MDDVNVYDALATLKFDSTKQGSECLLRRAIPSREFLTAWKRERELVESMGYSVINYAGKATVIHKIPVAC